MFLPAGTVLQVSLSGKEKASDRTCLLELFRSTAVQYSHTIVILDSTAQHRVKEASRDHGPQPYQRGSV